MRKIIIPLILVLLCVTFYACKKDSSTESYSPNITNPVKSDLNVTVITSVNGFVTDQNDSAVVGATVTAGTSVTTTDKYGYFSITDVSLSKIAGFIKVVDAGYFTAYKTFVSEEGQKTFTRLKLIPKTNVGVIDNSTGGSATTTDGAIITLPANSVVLAAGGGTYTGHVHIAAHFIDPTNEEVMRLNAPGDLRGVDTINNIKSLLSYGMLAVELTGDGGQLLQIATGQHATLSFPIPSTLLSSAPASIPLWSFDETNGLWKEESTATKTGSNYVGNVPHFSYWNCDFPLAISVPFRTQIVDSALHPLANITVEISTAAGDFTGCHGETDSNGYIYGYLPGNSDLTLQVLTPCGTLNPIKEFTSATTDIDLGTIKTTNTSVLNSITITGTLLNCDSLPVANGFLMFQPQNGGDYINITVTNGQFNYSQLSCGNGAYTYSMTSYDYQNGSYSTDTRTITLNDGTNNLGSFKECTDSSATITISYPNGGAYCTSDTGAMSVTYTGPSTTGTYSSQAGLTINPATGAITPSTSSPGTYTVTYTTAAQGGNPSVSVSTTVSITTACSANLSISYAGNPFCSSDGAAEPVTTISPVSNGTYSSSIGLTINAATGAITPSTSTPGTYTVTYTAQLPSGNPPQPQLISATTSVTITASPSATISYAGAPFCSILGAGQAVTMSGTAGGMYSSTPGLSIDTATGAINPSTSTAGSYTVTYTMVAGGCGVQPATTQVAVTTLPSATISYAGSPFCSSLPGVQAVTQTGTAGGTYSSTAGLTINAATGAITPSNSTADTYIVTYTMAAAGGCAAQTATTSVTINPSLSTVISPGASTTTTVAFNWTAVAGATGYTLSYTINGGANISGGSIAGTTYTATGLSSGDVVNLTVTPIGSGCYSPAYNTNSAL
jgi:hypothetical protein